MRGAYAVLLVGLAWVSGAHAGAQARFGDDVAFLRAHRVRVTVLRRGAAQVVVVPAYQCRVMTSTAAGSTGTSFGWVNRSLIASGKIQPHINVYGGEDQFWLGPEGGQFALFFKKGSPFDLAHWQTPAVIDTEPFQVAATAPDHILCRRTMSLANYAGTRFQISVTREVALRDPAAVLHGLGVDLPPNLQAVAFSTTNTVQNTGSAPWTKEGGLLSIWILGMFNATPRTTVVAPYQPGSTDEKGDVVHAKYFGDIPPDRLRDDDGVLYFKADANFRSKIGIPAQRVRHIMGSFDAVTRTLTLVTFTLRPDASEYVNSMWEIQKAPFGGDVANAYNDGPPKPGAKQLGRFYELESSSPALALAPGQSETHVQTTIHIQGSRKDLDVIAVALLGRGTDQIMRGLR